MNKKLPKLFSGIKDNLVLVILFFLITPVVLGSSLLSLYSLSKIKKSETKNILGSTTINNIEVPEPGAKLYASLPISYPIFSNTLNTNDARIEVIRQYLENYRSPLAPFAEFIVTTSDKYSLDYRILTAIAQQESNLCKLIPPNSHNCWGWGIHSEGTLGFKSYEEAIELVAQGIKEEYIDKGFVTIEEIMSKYTPLSPGSWAAGVNTFMEEMEEAN